MPVRSTSACDDRHGQVVGADVAKDALLLVRPANRRADAIDDDGAFHRMIPRKLSSDRLAILAVRRVEIAS